LYPMKPPNDEPFVVVCVSRSSKAVTRFDQPYWAPKMTPSQRTWRGALSVKYEPRRYGWSGISAAAARRPDAQTRSPHTRTPAVQYRNIPMLRCEAILWALPQVVEAPAHTEADFVGCDILDQGGTGSGVVAGQEIAEIDVAVADVHHEVGRERHADAAHDRPSQIPLRVFTSADRRSDGTAVVGGAEIGGPSTGADIGRHAIPGAEIEIAVEQRAEDGDFGG